MCCSFNAKVDTSAVLLALALLVRVPVVLGSDGPSVNEVGRKDTWRAIYGAEPITIIDVRSADAFKRGHIAAAINMPHGDGSISRLPADYLKALIYGQGRNEDGELSLAARLREKGYLKADIYEGGYFAWQHLSRREMKFLLGQIPQPVVVAVMGREIFCQSHIAGSIQASLAEGVQAVSSQVKNRAEPIIIYGLDYADRNPGKLADKLSQAGYTNLRIYNEGLRGMLCSDILLAGDRCSNPRIPRSKRKHTGLDNPLVWPLLWLLKVKD